AAERLCATTRNASSALATKLSSSGFVSRIFGHAIEDLHSKSGLVHSLTVSVRFEGSIILSCLANKSEVLVNHILQECNLKPKFFHQTKTPTICALDLTDDYQYVRMIITSLVKQIFLPLI
ncbi:unnamed protein product, partial [Brassica rapa]